MKNKIPVKICIGTSCHLMGAPVIIDYLQSLPAAIKDRITISFVTCLHTCDQGPRVNIGDRTLFGAIPETVGIVIKEMIRVQDITEEGESIGWNDL